MSPTMIDRTYWGAAGALAVWGVVIGFTAAFLGDDVSDEFAFFSLTGGAIVGGLWLERQSARIGRWAAHADRSEVRSAIPPDDTLPNILEFPSSHPSN